MNDYLYPSVPPEYPHDGDEPTVQELANTRLTELLTKLAIYVVPARDSRLTLIALFYACGVDLSYLLNVPNTETAIAKKFGVSKQKFSLLVKEVRRDFNLHHAPTVHHGRQSQVYENNYRKPKAI